MTYRVLFPYVGNTVGGSHVSSLLLARNLSNRFEPVVAVQKEGLLTEYLSQIGMPYIKLPDCPLPRLRPMWRQLKTVRSFRPQFTRFLSQNGISLVHSHDMKMHSAWSETCRHLEIPHIWHQRTPSPSNHTHKLSRFSAKRLVVSEFCKSQLPTEMARTAVVVYNPISDSRSDKAAMRERLVQLTKVPDESILVGTVSNLSNRKRPSDFVKMAHQLRNDTVNGRKFHFIIIGETREPYYSALSNLISELGVVDTVSLVGAVYPAQDYISGLDVLVAPAENEAFGRTLVEGMLGRVPVVASKDAGHLEIIENGKTGYLEALGDITGFASRIVSLSTELESTEALIDNAFQDAGDRFSVSKHIDKMEGIYSELLTAGQGPHEN